MIERADDFRHKLPAKPFARESLFYNLVLPDEGLIVFLYTWVDDAGRAGHLVTAVTGEDERLAASAVDGIEVGDMDFDDWSVAGLGLRHAEALERAEFDVDVEGLSLRMSWQALHPPFSYASDSADGCPSFVADDRFEQTGRVTGTLTLGERVVAFDTLGHRDHSWGVRDWAALQDWKWISVQAADGTLLHLMLIHAHGETTRHGYVVRDGVVTEIADARVHGRYDARWWQTDATLLGTLVDGTPVMAELSRFAFFAFDAGERTSLHEAGCTGTLDGVPAIGHWECGWDRAYVALQAERAAA